MIQLTDLEEALFDALLAGDLPVLAQLRAQFAAATATHRTFSGVGFFTHFEVPASIPPIDTRHWVISDVTLEHPEVPNGAIIMLFVVDGVISMLEGVTNGDATWPSNESHYSVEYHRRLHPAGNEFVRSPTRDLAELEAEYARVRSRA